MTAMRALGLRSVNEACVLVLLHERGPLCASEIKEAIPGWTRMEALPLPNLQRKHLVFVFRQIAVANRYPRYAITQRVKDILNPLLSTACGGDGTPS